MKAVVLAAGKGVRLDPFTEKLPKHLLPVAGSPLIFHTLKSIKAIGIDEVLIVVHHMKAAIESALGDGKAFGLKLSYIDQREALGTGHALKTAETFVGKDPFLLVYGDLALKTDVLFRLLQSYSEQPSDLIGGVSTREVGEYGALEIDRGALRRVLEKPPVGGQGIVNAGVYVLSEEIFRALDEVQKSPRGEVELTSAINLLLERGHKFMVVPIMDSEWVDVGRPWNLLEANRMLLASQISACRIAGDVEANVQIRGNAVIEEGASVLSGTYIEGPVWISPGCRVGPNSYIRPFTYLCKGVRVGNGCEVKGSIIMEASHIGHLSYIGDSVIGPRCNLGAGTITANLRFDEAPIRVTIKESKIDTGMRKLGAFLGEGVKTGINVSFYPGVKVGPETWIAPHIAVDRDLPPRVLASAKIDLMIRQRR